MSTKPIREALERIQCTCRDHSCVGCKAEAAVSAIERAAMMLPVPGIGSWDQPEWDKSIRTILELMQSIAKDAP